MNKDYDAMCVPMRRCLFASIEGDDHAEGTFKENVKRDQLKSLHLELIGESPRPAREIWKDFKELISEKTWAVSKERLKDKLKEVTSEWNIEDYTLALNHQITRFNEDLCKLVRMQGNICVVESDKLNFALENHARIAEVKQAVRRLPELVIMIEGLMVDINKEMNNIFELINKEIEEPVERHGDSCSKFKADAWRRIGDFGA